MVLRFCIVMILRFCIVMNMPIKHHNEITIPMVSNSFIDVCI